MVGKAWRLVRTRRRRAAWAAGRLGGHAGRLDRASDRRREMADLHYDGLAALAPSSGTSAPWPLPFSNALIHANPSRRAHAASVRVCPCRWRSEVQEAEDWQDRKKTLFSDFNGTGPPALLVHPLVDRSSARTDGRAQPMIRSGRQHAAEGRATSKHPTIFNPQTSY